MYIDTHCHLDYLQKDNDLKDIVQSAWDANVRLLHTISTRLDESAMIKGIADQFDNVFCSIGVHPNESSEVTHLSQTQITDALLAEVTDKVISFGETGLDYYYEHSDRATQHKSFLAHIDAAKHENLPLVIHSRDADTDTVKYLQSDSAQGVTGIIHCFTGSPEMAKACLDLGYYISISGIATFKTATQLQDIVRWLPLDRILIETDSPYLAPMPYRGKPNQPAYVVHVAEKVAELKGLPLKDVIDQTTQNFMNVCPKVQKNRLPR
ncbi:TatD family hydrolase [Candidatus Bodocaedibacter vickermanii]|uniref:Putative metal-dependent hydrolase YcfH n=1 Tax=Candidatus Bodocaedibacter vickermanii TaxID=2741701 RepID=A0A7L9RS77_9PROT|nr:putative metal-dependent hydrolase YcfH [Candidatus Paracaedibacteraceae bacterium 'Lake Konstanz']